MIRMIAVSLCLLGTLATVGCGSSNDDSGASPAEIQAAKDEQRRIDKQAEQNRELQRQLDQVKRQQKRASTKKSSSAPKSSSPSSPPSGGTSSSPTSCGGGVRISGPTSCGFALNIAAAFRAGGPGTVYADSPATGKSYWMECSSAGVCSGGSTVGGATVFVD